MSNSNSFIFSQLIEHAKLSDRALDNAEKIRWIKTTAEEKEWLKEVKFEPVEIIPSGIKTSTFVFNQKNYFIIIGQGKQLNADLVFRPTEINAGLLTALISEFKIPIKDSITPLEVIDQILPIHKDTTEYEGHDAALIAKFFNPIFAYEIDANSPITPKEPSRLSCHWVIKSKHGAILPFSPVTIQILERIIANGSQSIPFINLINSFQSAHWQHAFLEIYRCIERLFAFQFIEDLHKDLAIAISLLDFSAKIEKTINWRPKEEDAIMKLFDFAPKGAINLIEGVKIQQAAQAEQKTPNWFYTLRNSVVHFRPAISPLKLHENQWDEVLQASLWLIESLYQKYDPQLKVA